jgi:phage portal protein BeeE
MTYATIESERRDLVDLALRPYMTTVESRLSLGDVTPRGQVVRFDLADFYRADFPTQIDTYGKAIAAGIMSIDEVRAAMKLNPSGGR